MARREFLRAGLGAGLAVGPLSGVTALAGCSGARPQGAPVLNTPRSSSTGAPLTLCPWSGVSLEAVTVDRDP